MKLLLLLAGLSCQLFTFSQSKDPIEVTPEIQRKIRGEIEKEIPRFKQKLEVAKENPVRIEFAIDTFRLERFMDKWIDLDYGDFGMRDACYAGAKLYDSLLNNYYKKLLEVLKGDDKQVLIQAQRSWLAFRDSEFRLVETISKDEYSGGGTMQQLTEASEYLDLVRNRVVTIFDHYVRATQSY
jgi:uncharacterized protein YecT (DUF1311 family)